MKKQNFHEVVLCVYMLSQGHYEKVMRVWESEKELNRADSALYTVVMAMSEHMKSAELAGEVKDDMERQHLIMEPQYVGL